jgi:hypothetical protein
MLKKYSRPLTQSKSLPMETQTDSVRYPIGQFEKPEKILKSHITRWRREIERLPRSLKQLVAHLSDEQLDTPYRDRGWTIRQVIHHLADSHAQTFGRMKLALTEDMPTIKPYNEKLWSELPDSRTADIRFSLMMLQGIHKRMGILIRLLNREDYRRSLFHPGLGHSMSVGEIIGRCAWHGNHHLAHIRNLIKARGW